MTMSLTLDSRNEFETFLRPECGTAVLELEDTISPVETLLMRDISF